MAYPDEHAPGAVCSNCRWLKPNAPRNRPWGADGECRRHAPRVEPRTGSDGFATVWPLVQALDFCGDFLHYEAQP